jgi:hypothetical protein
MSDDWEWDTDPSTTSEITDSDITEFRKKNKIFEALYVKDLPDTDSFDLPAIVKYRKNGKWHIVPPRIEYIERESHMPNAYTDKNVAMVTAKMMYLTGVWDASK